MGGIVPLAAVASSAVFVAALIWVLVKPPRPLAQRVRPYSTATRAELRRSPDAFGQASSGPVFGQGTLRRLFEPIFQGVTGRLSRIVTSTSDEVLALRLRQAGLYPETPEELRPQEYRMRTLGRAVLAAIVIGLIGLSLFQSPLGVVVFGGLGFALGLLTSRSRVDQAIAERRERIRGELYNRQPTHRHADAGRGRCGRGDPPRRGPRKRSGRGRAGGGSTPARTGLGICRCPRTGRRAHTRS